MGGFSVEVDGAAVLGRRLEVGERIVRKSALHLLQVIRCGYEPLVRDRIVFG